MLFVICVVTTGCPVLIQEMLSGSRRSLLATALTNVADVTVEMVADDSSIVSSALAELNFSITNGTLSVSLLCAYLQCALMYLQCALVLCKQVHCAA